MATINGSGLNDTLTGTAGDDTIDGRAGSDTLIGLGGNDLYIFDRLTDAVVEIAGGGVDTVKINFINDSATAVIVDMNTVGFANVENLLIARTGLFNIIGNGYDNIITGNASSNMVDGGSGNDTLDGGAGADKMIGGEGADTYYLDNAGDIISDTGIGEGTSTVISKVSIATLHGSVGQLTLAGTNGIDANGNDFANVMTGNSAANTLAGRGGHDELRGGLGNDSYVIAIGDDLDMVEELAGEGTDTVLADISYTLGANIEKLALQDGNTHIDGTGNELVNVITGNSYNNTLDGAGGVDTLDGGRGNDTFIVDIAAVADVITLEDKVKEKADEGIDTLILRGSVMTTGATTLTLAANLENLDISATDTTQLHLTGNASGNVLTGNEFGNTLFGKKGDDTLLGRGGEDTYRFQQGDGHDSLFDNDGIDKILLGSGITVANTSYCQSGNDLVIRYGTQGDIVRVKEYFVDNSIDQVVFHNGTVHDFDYINSHLSTFATDGDDVLTGTAGRDLLEGLSGTDTLEGLGGDDYLVGGGFFGDSLYGGDGNDIIEAGFFSGVVDGGAGDDTIIFDGSSLDTTVTGGEGVDTLVTNDNNGLSLFSDIENLYLLQFATLGTGNGLDNIIRGSGGALTLDGGAGNDTLIGLGGDTFIVDSVNDVVIAGNAAGPETIVSTVSWDLHVNGNVEYLTLAGSGNINGIGNSLENYIAGNAGDNTLDGGNGADVMFGGGGNDSYIVDNFNDYIEGGTGIDTIYSSIYYYLYSDSVENLTLTGIDDIAIDGNQMNNTLTGNSGNNVITGGGGGEDLMIGAGGNDTLVGGFGIATLAGGAGDDVYKIDNAGGVSVIVDSEGSNAVVMFPVIPPSITYYGQLGDDLVIRFDFYTETILVRGFFSEAGHIDKVVFDDGTVHDAAYIASHLTSDVITLTEGNDFYEIFGSRGVVDGGDGNDVITGSFGSGNDTIFGGAGRDTLEGWSGDDTLDGGRGNDLLRGMDGRDSYTFKLGDGGDRIEDYADNDKIIFAEGIAPEDVAYSWSGGDLVISYGNLGDSITVTGFLTDAAQRIERIIFDDGSEHDVPYILAQLPPNLQLLTQGGDNYFGEASDEVVDGWDGNDFLVGEAGDDALYGREGEDFIHGSTGNDTIEGGAGDDWMVGDDGDDIYVFSAGDGADLIEEGFTATDDSIVFTAGVTAEDTVYYDDGMGSLVITYGQSDDSIFIWGFMQADVRQIEHVRYHDGTEHDLAYILSHLYTSTVPTEGDDVINGGIFDDVIDGLGGNDTIHGRAGNDQLSGGEGNDTLQGDAGFDQLAGGGGDDSLVIDADDAVDGGEGVDTIFASAGFIDINNYSGVENVILTGEEEASARGDGGDNYLRANDSGLSQLYGGDGNDTLESGGVSAMFGGYGNDTYYLHNESDYVLESMDQSEGIDTIYSDASVTLDGGIEYINLTGTADANVQVWADNNNITVTGNSGNNTLSTAYGNDLFMGGDGDDTYFFYEGTGADTVVETSGSDAVSFAEGIEAANTVYTRSGDTLVIHYGVQGSKVSVSGYFADGADTIERVVFFDGTEHDAAYIAANLSLTGATPFDDAITGTDGADTLTALAGDDTVYGLEGDDTLSGDEGNDYLNGGSDNDTYLFQPGDGVDTVEEEGGNDIIIFDGVEASEASYYRSVNDLVISNGNPLDFISVKNFFSGATYRVELVQFDGGLQHDVDYILANYVSAAAATEGDDFLIGTPLDDTIDALGGNDTINGGGGADTISGGEGDDQIHVDQFDMVDGGDGIDTIYGGFNLITLGAYTGVENLILTGTNVITGFGTNEGDNYMRGNDATSCGLVGGGGNDTLEAGSGSCDMQGGSGDDVYYVHNEGDLAVDQVGNGIDTIYADANCMITSSIEFVYLTGTADIEARNNGLEDVVITGNIGNNHLYGGYAADVLIGGDGDDVLEGRNGHDTLEGQGGADTYVFIEGPSQGDLIIGFDGAEDKIDFADLLSGYDPLTMALADFVGVSESGGDTILSVDANGLSGGSSFVQIAAIVGQTGFGSADDMVTAGQLVIV